nr:hypothetical protein [Tanacetum cinerariifolium]
MKRNILVVGAGFGGVWSALSAARLLDLQGSSDVQITVLAPQAELRIRPRFYESNVHEMKASLLELFDVTGVSQLIRPNITGIEHAFDVDEIEAATCLEKHINALGSYSDSEARNTVVVCGGGFTGIETATELPKRLR